MSSSLFKSLQPDIQWDDDALNIAWVLKIVGYQSLKNARIITNPTSLNHSLLNERLGQKITTKYTGSYTMAAEDILNSMDYYLYVNQDEAYEQAKRIEKLNSINPKLNFLVSKRALNPGFFIQWPYSIIDDHKKELHQKLIGLNYFVEHNDTGILGFYSIGDARASEPILLQFIQEHNIDNDAVSFSYHFFAAPILPYSKNQDLEVTLREQASNIKIQPKVKI